ARKAAPKTVQKASPQGMRSTKKPHPGTDPRQPDDRDGNEGFHRANPPTPSKPARKAPRQASLSKANPRSASPSKASLSKANPRSASPSKASLSKSSPRKASLSKASPGAKRSRGT